MPYSSEALALQQLPKMIGATVAELDWDNAVIPFVDNYIDNKLRGYFDLPFPTAGTPLIATEPTVLQMATMLYAGHAQNIRFTEDDPTRIVNNFFWKEGRKMLQQIRAGIIKLDLSIVTIIRDVDDTNAKQDVDSTTIDLRPVFNMGSELDWEDMVVDPVTGNRLNPEDA